MDCAGGLCRHRKHSDIAAADLIRDHRQARLRIIRGKQRAAITDLDPARHQRDLLTGPIPKAKREFVIVLIKDMQRKNKKIRIDFQSVP